MIRPVSRKRAARMRERRKLVERSEPQACEWCHLEPAVDTHELVRRSQRRDAMIDLDVMVPIGRACHDWATTHPEQAVERGMARWYWQDRAAYVRNTYYAEESMVIARKSNARALVEARDHGVCAHCDPAVPPWDDDLWEADHIIPLADGGANDLENMATLCLSHHRRKTRLETGRRPGRPNMGRIPVTIKIDADDLQWIDEQCERRGVDRSEALRRLVNASRRAMPMPPPITDTRPTGGTSSASGPRRSGPHPKPSQGGPG